MNASELLRFPRLVTSIVRMAPQNLLRTRPAAGGFALVEHACHLADLEADGFTARIDRLLAEDDPHLPDFDGERVARERRYHEQDAALAAARFLALREQNVERMRGFTERQWNRAGIQEGVGPVTLRAVARKMSEHDAAHARELADLLGELGLSVPPELLTYPRPLSETA